MSNIIKHAFDLFFSTVGVTFSTGLESITKADDKLVKRLNQTSACLFVLTFDLLLCWLAIYRCLGYTTVWPNFAKLLQFGKTLQVVNNFLTIYFLFGKMLSQIWQIWYIIGLILIVVNGQILKNNLTIRSQWSSRTIDQRILTEGTPGPRGLTGLDSADLLGTYKERPIFLLSRIQSSQTGDQ